MILSTTTNAPSARTATLFKVRERALLATPTVLRAKVQQYAMDAFPVTLSWRAIPKALVWPVSGPALPAKVLQPIALAAQLATAERA